LRLQLRVTKEAERQIREASAWWHANRPAARGLFRQELTRGFDFITTQPEIGTRALDTAIRGVRRLHLIRIRYYLYYRVRNDDSVEVVALWHTSRGKGPSISS
jgi:plasmid stabilization system protein ParE